MAKNRAVYRGRQKGITKSKPTRAGQLRKQGLRIPEIANLLAVSERTVFRYSTWQPVASLCSGISHPSSQSDADVKY